MKRIFLVESVNRDNDQKAILGFRKALEVAINEELKNIVIVVPSIGSFDSTDLGSIIDSLNVKNLTASRLRRHQPVILEGGINIRAIPSNKISKSLGYNEVDILVAYASTEKDMEEIDSLYNVKNIIYIPWMESEEEYVKNKWTTISV